MSTKPMLTPQVVHHEYRPGLDLTYFQRAVLRRGHPRYILIATVGGIWTFYFLWMHNWIWALTTILVSTILGIAATSDVNVGKLSQTKLGKIMLLHLHPANVVVQFGGVVVLFYSVWMHSPEIIMAAVSVILIGHLWGWHKVHDAL